ncbi:MAG: endolytic transglycosylase MltG [Crocinitomicaceae bacterium]
MKRIFILVVVVLLLVAAFFIGKPLYNYHFKTLDTLGDSEGYILYVPSAATVQTIADSLSKHELMSETEFLDFAEKFELTDEKVEAGKYRLSGGMKIKSLIYGLKNGNQEVKDVQITFNNSRDIYDMAAKVAPAIEADSAEIVNHLEDPETLLKFGFTKATIPSLFLPDTYEIGEWDMSAEEFVRFMADQYKEFWDEERQAKAIKLGITQSEVATVASIIEAEQGINQQEWPTIAGLYLNRIRDNWKLQSDPTAKFCWGDELEGVQRLLQVHMQKDCPYNTYLYPGLPPGPIRIPSKKAIDAVLNAERHNYYYMCARPDNSGLHNFAYSLSEHNSNAAKFRKYLRTLGL